jgi:hypothetical protein
VRAAVARQRALCLGAGAFDPVPMRCHCLRHNCAALAVIASQVWCVTVWDAQCRPGCCAHAVPVVKLCSLFDKVI